LAPQPDDDRFPLLGPTLNGDGTTTFRVWAPVAHDLMELVYRPPGHDEQVAAMTSAGHDVWEVTVGDAPPGTGYSFRVDRDVNRTWPDPLAIQELRHGDVNGPSLVVALSPESPLDPPEWHGVTAEHLATGVMEVHVGSDGLREAPQSDTFDGMILRLEELARMGLAGIEVMPVSIAVGDFDWGYNGVDPGSVRTEWGGWAGLTRLVAAAHERGLAVGLDVVGNHVGPDGGYVHAYGQFSAGRAPWGDFPDFEQTGVREWWLQSIERLARAGIDFFRLDAVQGMYYEREPVRPHVLIETGRRLAALAEAGEIERAPLLVVEAGTEWLCENIDWLLRPVDDGGAGVAGFWDDELRHAVFLWGFTIPPEEDALIRMGLPAYFTRVAGLIRADEGDHAFTGPVRATEVAGRIERPTVAGKHLPIGARWRCWRNHDQTGNQLLGLDSGMQGLLVRLTRHGLDQARAQAVAEAVVDGAVTAGELAEVLTEAPPAPSGVMEPSAEELAEQVARAEELDRALFAFVWSQPGTAYDFDHSQFPYGHSSSQPDVVKGTLKGRAEEFGFEDLADDDDTAFTMPVPHDPATHRLARRTMRDVEPGRFRLLHDLAQRRAELGLAEERTANAVGVGDEGIVVLYGSGDDARLLAVNRGDEVLEADPAELLGDDWPGGTWEVVLSTADVAYGGRGGHAGVRGKTLVVPPRTLIQLVPR
jgi:hypothetical protein